MTKTPCCEKCSYTANSNPDRTVCIAKDCICHTPKEKGSWEDSFSAKFMARDGVYLAYKLEPGKIINFIRSLLASERAELVERVDALIESEGKETNDTQIGANWAFLTVLALLTNQQ